MCGIFMMCGDQSQPGLQLVEKLAIPLYKYKWIMVQFQICHSRRLEALKTHLYWVSFDLE